MRTGIARLAVLLVALGVAGGGALAAEPLVPGGFTPPAAPGEPPVGWEALTFPRVPRHTRYTVVREHDA